MGELEDRISSILNDPGQLAQLRAMAQSLMGAPEAEASAGKGSAVPPEGLAALLRGGLGEKSPRLAALEALGKCLGEKRREKLARAMRLARVLRLAQAGLLGTEEKDV